MSGFIDLKQAQSYGDRARSDYRAEVLGEISDATALKIVTQDVQLAESYILEKRQPQAWENADNLYRALVTPKSWPGTDVPMSNLSMPVVLEGVEKIMPVIFSALFSDKTPFLLTPTEKPLRKSRALRPRSSAGHQSLRV